MMADHFLLKSSHSIENCLSSDGLLAIERHAELSELLGAEIGPEAVALFAEPFVSRDKSGKLVQIAWYGARGGSMSPLDEMEPQARRATEDRLHILLPRVEALAKDPLIKNALSIASKADILSVDGHPVLVNWGIRTGLEQDPLAGYLQGIAAEVGPQSVTTVSSTQDSRPTPPRVLPEAAPLSRIPLMAWLPLALLLGLAVIALIWVLWPGTRIFPGPGLSVATIDATRAAEIDSLRARRDALQAALNGAQCRPDGQLVLPGNISPEGLAVPDIGQPALIAPGPVAPDAPVAPSPGRVSLPSPEGESTTLLDAIEASTVLVLGGTANGVSTGSGFVVGLGLIVTNHHVIDGATADRIYVINARLGRAVPARILKAEGPFEATGRDFALLQIEPMDLPALPLADPSTSTKLNHVVSSGFPGDVMETDAAFARLMEGDGAAIPDLVVVDGTVNARQTMNPGTDVLVHSAPLSSGNSGGPLVDFCGRVLGVNTFVRQGPMRTLNFAVATSALSDFLVGTPAAVTPDTSTCKPSATAPQAQPAPRP